MTLSNDKHSVSMVWYSFTQVDLRLHVFVRRALKDDLLGGTLTAQMQSGQSATYAHTYWSFMSVPEPAHDIEDFRFAQPIGKATNNGIEIGIQTSKHQPS